MSKTKTSPAPVGDASGGDPTQGLTGVPLALAQALLAEPGGAAALLALAAGTSRPTASRVLVAMEAQGLVRRESGERGEGNGRRPDRWYLTVGDPAAPDVPEAEAGTGGERPARAEKSEVPEPESADAEETAANPAAADPGPAEQDTAELVTDQADSAPLPAGEPEPGDGGADPAVAGASQDSGGREPGGHDGDRSEPADATGDRASEGAGTPPPPASGPVVDAGQPGQPCPTCGHRVRAVAPRADSGGGSRLGQGQLHGLALEHLRAHPEQEWTATGIAKEIGRSSGAIANALVTMVNRGEAEMTCAAPRRYRAVSAGDALGTIPGGSAKS